MPFIIKPTISETFLARVRATPNLVGFMYKTPESGRWKQITYAEFFSECRLVSFGLMGLGLEAGDKVVILSNTRYEWSLCDMAILGARAVTVPIYASNTAEDVVYIMNHSEARVAIVEDVKQLQKIFDKRLENPKCLPKLEKIIVLEQSAMALTARYPENDVLALDALKEIGRRTEAKEPSRFADQLAAARPSDLLTICYTSGTTGIPKGAMLTHDNMMSVLEDCRWALDKNITPEKDVIVSFLPFSHILGKVESMSVYVFGFRQAFAESIDKLMTNIGEVRPTILFAVPRTFEKAYSRVKAAVESAPRSRRKAFDWAFRAGSRFFTAAWEDRRPGLKDTIEYQLAKSLVFSEIVRRFGGRLKFAVCGGAPLPKEIGEFFKIVGIEILEGYGLTETCAPVTANTPEAMRFGSVGRPLREVTVKIAGDGEILIKSRKVFQGYYRMPKETAEALVDGWFYTGDIGYLDDDGFLHITDRKKDLIITSGGKNIAPQRIENLARTYKLINEFVVQGDSRHYLTALLTLNQEQAIRFANESQILFSEYSELVKHSRVIAAVQKIVDEINKQLASYETIKRFVILPHDFTIESGELTPSLKVRRNVINKRYKALVDSMYA